MDTGVNMDRVLQLKRGLEIFNMAENNPEDTITVDLTARESMALHLTAYAWESASVEDIELIAPGFGEAISSARTKFSNAISEQKLGDTN